MEHLLATPVPSLRHGNTLFFAEQATGSEEWQRQQTESIDRYQAESYEEDATIGQLFGGFIAVTLDRDGPVLDIGCGLHPLLPHYVTDLDLPQFIGIEPLTTRVDRDYFCLAGVTAEKLPLKPGIANAAIFATSLDHMEDARGAIAEVRRVLKPDAPLYFWLGVHDPHILAEAKTFGNVHTRSTGLRKIARILAAPIEHIALARKMTKRRHDLRHGVPLDRMHVRYHTVAGINAEMDGYGLTIVRRVLIPGTNSLFVEARGAQDK